MKKLISALLSAALLAGVAAMPAAAEETYSLGDVTMDGVVDVADAIEILYAYTYALIGYDIPLTEEQQVLADVIVTPGNYAINSADAVTVLEYYTYTMIAETPVSMDAYLANESVYLNETINSENYEDVVNDIFNANQA